MNAGQHAVMQRWLISAQKLSCSPSAMISRPPSRTTRSLGLRSIFKNSLSLGLILGIFRDYLGAQGHLNTPAAVPYLTVFQGIICSPTPEFQAMANPREPLVHPIPILDLRPTQMTVGMREVKEKRKRFREHTSKKKQAELIGRHMIPVVRGPDQHYYVVDHHHLARALHDEGIKDILVTVIGDLTMVARDAFWGVMDNKRWVYPYDVKGARRRFKDIPKSIVDLK